jgi:hypothetical protein
MSRNAQQLYELLPAIYRQRDTELGGPLKELIAVLSEQMAVVQEGLDQAYDDLFIETCAEWVVPYIGDLIGANLLPSSQGTISQRAQVADELANRRRKGTLSVTEEIAADVTGYPVAAVEFFRRLITTQSMLHPRPDNLATVDVRLQPALEKIDTAFDTAAHTFEARRARSGRGRYNIPNIGLFLYTVRPFPLTLADTAVVSDFRRRFNPLGLDTPLYHPGRTEESTTKLAESLDMPQPITRTAMRFDKGSYYGAGAAVSLRVDGVDIPEDQVEVCNLADMPGGSGDWAHAPADVYAIDPQLGRIALPTGSPRPDEVLATFYYGASDAIGGGEYERGSYIAGTADQQVPATDLAIALAAVSGGGIVEITNSRTYRLAAGTFTVDAGQSLELRAVNGARPLIVMEGGDLVFSGGDGASVTLSGLVITGGSVRLQGTPRAVTLMDCTLVPASTPSLFVEPDNVTAAMQRSITGAVRVAEGSSITVTHSIVDALAEDAIAYAAVDDTRPGGPFSADEATVYGTIHTLSIGRVSDSILFSMVLAERTQSGCVRYSYLPWLSQAPRRYECHPASAEEDAQINVQFRSRTFSSEYYFRLSTNTSAEIRKGAEDEGEMGCYHALALPQREADLRIKLDEFLRFGLEPGVYYAT